MYLWKTSSPVHIHIKDVRSDRFTKVLLLTICTIHHVGIRPRNLLFEAHSQGTKIHFCVRVLFYFCFLFLFVFVFFFNLEYSRLKRELERRGGGGKKVKRRRRGKNGKKPSFIIIVFLYCTK